MEILNEFFTGVFLLKPRVFGDERGFFQESYNQKTYHRLGIFHQFVQDNHSLSIHPHTVRGIHFQYPPFDQTKLVRVITGKIKDYVVDLRVHSPTFGHYEEVELSSDNSFQLLIPKGFGHAFCTLTENVHVVYKVDNYYSPECNGGIIFNDPSINIRWPSSKIVLSEQDKKWPTLNEVMDKLNNWKAL